MSKVTFYPIILLLSCFLLDKIFLLEEVKSKFISWKRFERSAYETREVLFDFVKEDYKTYSKEEFIFLFGSSRTAPIRRDAIEKNRKEVHFYNFCVAYPGISYQYYWLNRLLKQGIRPDVAILELDELLLTNTANKYSFSYLFDFSFIINHLSVFSNENGFSTIDFFQYLKTRLFAITRFPFSFDAIKENQSYFQFIKNNELVRVKKEEVSKLSKGILIDLIHSNHGGIGALVPKDTNLDFRKDAKLKWEQYFFKGNFPSPSQKYFLKEFISLTKKNNIQLMVVIPQTSKEFLEIIENSEEKKEFDLIFGDIVKKNKDIIVLDMQKAQKCNSFEDSFHIEQTCIEEITSRVMESLPRKLK